MGLLSRFPGLLQGWGAFDPFGQQQQNPLAPTPFFPQQPPEAGNLPTPPFVLNANTQQPAQAPPQQQATQGGFMQRMQGMFDNPALQLGVSLLGHARGSDWAGVGQDMQGFSQQRMLKQRMDNEERRQSAASRRDEQRFDWMGEDRQRQTTQRSALDQWITTLPAEQQAAARANPEAAYEAFMQSQIAATQPITPYQQAQLDLERRGQGLSYSAQMAGINRDRPLRGPDAQLMDEVRDAAGRSQALTMLGQEFLSANGVNPTGELSRFNPLNFVDPNRSAMRAASAQMRSYMRPPGSGATSDYEQRIYAMGVPSTENTGPQNQAIMRYHAAAAQLAQQRRYFYEQYASQNGTLNGAEQAFQASPEFTAVQRAAPLQGEPQQRGSQGGGQQQRPQQRSSFDSLPSPQGMREGQTITDTQTGRQFVIRGGRWVPAQNINGFGGASRPIQ